MSGRCSVAQLIWKTVWGRGTFGDNFIPTAQLSRMQLPKICVQRDICFFDQPMISVRAPYNTIITCMCGQSLPFGLHVYIYIIIYIYNYIYIIIYIYIFIKYSITMDIYTGTDTDTQTHTAD